MSIIVTTGCCDSIVDLDHKSNDVMWDTKTNLYWHSDCALQAGKIDDEHYLAGVDWF